VKNIKNSVKLFDFTSFEFPEFLFSKLGSDGRLPFWLKCISFGAFLYCIGVVATYASNTLLPWTETSLKTPYLLDYSFMMICAISVCTLISLFSTLRKLDDAMVQVSKRIGALSTSADEKKFMEYVSYIKRWMPAGERIYGKPWFWYYLDTIGGAVLGALFSFYWITHSTSLWWGTIQHTVAALYFVSFCAVAAYIGGAIVFAIMGSIKAVRRYCRDFITPDRVFAMNPDKVGGLRPLGQFSLGLDISFALSSFVIFSYLVQGVSITHPVVIITLLLYTILLVVVFFIPLGAVHGAMLEAKERAYDQVNELFKKISSRVSAANKELNPKHVEALKDVCFLYERVSKMAVWPLNIGLVLKFVATSSFPIVGSLVVTYVSRLLGI
jgi:hypothetical protein